MASPLAFHSSATPEHGTPIEVIEASRRLLHSIDLDPASSRDFNARVMADRYYTAETDGLKHPWHGRVFVNPPGDRRGKLVKEFWAKLLWEYYHGRTTEAVWVGFSLEQLVSLQRLEGVRHPLQFPTCIPERRLKFGGNSPTHGNYITYVGANEQGFVDEFAGFGLIILPLPGAEVSGVVRGLTRGRDV